MAGFKRSVVIDQSPEKVFDFATDLKNASIFMPSVVKCEMLGDGVVKSGAKFRETRSMKGKEHSATIEIVEHERPRVHAARSAMMGMNATYTFRFTPENGATRIELEAEVKGNLLWKPFLGMLCRMMEKEDGEYLARVKQAMEKS